MTSAFGVVFKKGRGCVDLTDMGKGEEEVTIIDIFADVIYNWPHSLERRSLIRIQDRKRLAVVKLKKNVFFVYRSKTHLVGRS